MSVMSAARPPQGAKAPSGSSAAGAAAQLRNSPTPPTPPTRWQRLRRDYAPNPLQASVSLASLLIIAFMLWHVLHWAVLQGVFGATAQTCQDASGACWSVVGGRWRIILFGLYPYEEQWRSALSALIVIATVCCVCTPRLWTARAILAVLGIGYGLLWLFLRGGVPGLPLVPPSQWGGMTLTLFIYLTVIVFGLPTAIFLALLRQSRYPVVRWVTAFVVDVTRSLPLLTILFAAALIIPLALPNALSGDKLTRALIGFAFFFACYQSEIIRGGMQVVPRGQGEAAQALGLGYWRTMSMILLPQAVRICLPPTINQFVITFKETSLVVIVGLFDLMASARTAYDTAAWSAYYREVYVFVALIYLLGAIGLTRYGKFVEHRMAVGKP